MFRNDVYTAPIKNTYYIFLIDFLLQKFWIGMSIGFRIYAPKIQPKYESRKK